MRCSKCGWPNVSGAQTCNKCGTPLQEETFKPDNNGFKQTVNEADVFGGQAASPSVCPKCGYPLRPGVDKCPNCNNSIGQTQAQPQVREPAYAQHPPIKRRPTRLDAANVGNSFNGTVNPYVVNVEIPPVCILKPIQRSTERHELQPQEFEGSTIVLNRDNTEPNNPSITSKEQAVLSFVDGQWYIEDKSDQHTTFVQASTPTPLKDGDMILLGNRLFEFHE